MWHTVVMCYRAPGPRCNAHAGERLAAAQAAWSENPSPENAQRLRAAEEDFSLTPQGIDLADEASPGSGEPLRSKRQAKIDAAKLLEERNSGQKWSDVSLKEMDPGALTMALMDVADDESIDWGTSSPKDFIRAINHATFLHRKQTRTNRANFPRTAYIEHPLRNTLRLYRWGCSDGETLTATVLHDTVEDCAKGIVPDADKYEDEQSLRDAAVGKLKGLYGDRVGGITLSMSNEILPPGSSRADRVRSYVDHLKVELDDPQVFQSKMADFADNAGGLHHNLIEGQEGMVKRMATKYSLALPVFKEKLDLHRNTLPIAVVYEMDRCLHNTETRLSAILTKLK